METLKLHVWERQHLEPERWPTKGTTVGGYVLVTHADVAYITHHS